MPLAIEQINQDAGKGHVREAINQSIEQCLSEEKGKTQEQCADKVYGMARDRGLIE